jgi:hypothetical protein
MPQLSSKLYCCIIIHSRLGSPTPPTPLSPGAALELYHDDAQRADSGDQLCYNSWAFAELNTPDHKGRPEGAYKTPRPTLVLEIHFLGHGTSDCCSRACKETFNHLINSYDGICSALSTTDIAYETARAVCCVASCTGRHL